MTSVYSTTAWLEARQKALDRDEVCQDCGVSEDLHVHHITPVREFDDPVESHDLDNLVVLCQYCHPKWEGLNEVPNLLDEETKLKRSELVYDLSRDSIDYIAPEPAPRDVEEYFTSHYIQNPHRCGYCYSALPRTRGEMLRRSKEEYFGEVELVTKFAVRMGARHSSSPVSDTKFTTPCPEPSPVEPV